MKILCPILYHAHKRPHDLALISKEENLSYLSLAKKIQANADHFAKQGIKKGDRIAILAQKDLPTLITLWALMRLGAVTLLVREDLPLKELKTTLLSPISLQENTTKLKNHFFDADSPATLLYTSGTTAKPKIAMHSFGNHFYSALGLLKKIEYKHPDRWLLSLPLYHVSGLAILFRTFINGATAVISNKTLSEDISESQITHLSLVLTQLYRLKNTPKKNLKVVLIGGSALPKDLYAHFQERNWPLYPTYGMTEMSSTVILNGFPLPYRNLKCTQDGEILVKGKTLFLGYLNEKQEGWFPTKDQGIFDPYKGFFYKERKDRMFISGGENIQPEEIEQILLKTLPITKAYVTSMKDEEFGHRPIAYIESTEKIEMEIWKKKLKEHLPKWKIPIRFFPYSIFLEKSQG